MKREIQHRVQHKVTLLTLGVEQRNENDFWSGNLCSSGCWLCLGREQMATWLSGSKIMMSKYLMIQEKKTYKKQAASAKPHVSNQNTVLKKLFAVFQLSSGMKSHMIEWNITFLSKRARSWSFHIAVCRAPQAHCSEQWFNFFSSAGFILTLQSSCEMENVAQVGISLTHCCHANLTLITL